MKPAFFHVLFPALATSALLAGCATKPSMPEMGETFFETKINADGTKLFAFSMDMGRPDADGGNKERKGRGDRGRGQRGARGQGNAQSGADNEDRLAKQQSKLYAALDETLAENHYCREGYIEIDTHQTEGRVHLLGECKDAANELDRLDFPNP